MEGAGDSQQDQEGVLVRHRGDRDFVGDGDDGLAGEDAQAVFEILGAEQGRAVAKKNDALVNIDQLEQFIDHGLIEVVDVLAHASQLVGQADLRDVVPVEEI